VSTAPTTDGMPSELVHAAMIRYPRRRPLHNLQGLAFLPPAELANSPEGSDPSRSTVQGCFASGAETWRRCCPVDPPAFGVGPRVLLLGAPRQTRRAGSGLAFLVPPARTRVPPKNASLVLGEPAPLPFECPDAKRRRIQ
jgi:hypothetical protein